MAFIPRPRNLTSPMTGESIRLAQRESQDYRKAIRPPSATGGAPRLNPEEPGIVRAMPIPGPEAFEEPRAPRSPAEDAFQRRRNRSEGPVIPFLLFSRRPIDEYSALNEGFVQELAQRLGEGAGRKAEIQAALDIIGGPEEMAKRLLAQMHRAFELEADGLDLPSQIYASREGHRVRGIIDDIIAQRAMW